ncbi:Sec23-binding domain of Sec16-domain-containing protein [Sporodiniella umbellata]|nr:Sec23-binding domain of Sec16-domain-containing protein [Sporodiniella umbellata]
MTSRSENVKESIPSKGSSKNSPSSQAKQLSSNEKPSNNVADASVLFGNNDVSNDFFSSAQPSNASAANFFDQQQAPSETFFDHLGPNSNTENQEHVPPEPTSLTKSYDPASSFDQQIPENIGQEQTNTQWQQFDPNVHYYYDEQNQVHYYDPNTNQEYDMSQYGYDYNYDAQYYSQEGYDPNAYASQSQSAYDPNAYVQQNQNIQQTYDPNAYTGQNQSAQQTYDPNAYNGDQSAQQMYDPNAYSEDQSVQQTYDPNAYNGDQSAQQTYGPNAYSEDQSVQHTYDPNTYTAQDSNLQTYNPSAYTQEVYDPNSYPKHDQSNQQAYDHTYDTNVYAIQDSGLQQTYNPNAYTNPHESQYAPTQEKNSLELPPPNLAVAEGRNAQQKQSQPSSRSAFDNPQTEYGKHEEGDPNPQTIDPTIFLANEDQNSNKQLLESTQDVFESNFFDFNQTNNQEPSLLNQGANQETKGFSENSFLPVDSQTINEHDSKNKNNSPDLSDSVSYDQQDIVFENLQSFEHPQENHSNESDVMFNVPSSDHDSTSVNNLSNLFQENIAQRDLEHEQGSYSMYHPDTNNVQTEEALQPQQFNADEPSVDVEYFNYQEQPYSSDSIDVNTHSSSFVQNDTSVETPTATVDLQSVPFTSAQQDSELQFAEVQLAPVDSYTGGITTSNISYDNGTKSPELLNHYGPQTTLYEESQPTLNMYATAPSTMPPHRVTSPFGAPPPERILSPLGRTSMEYASSRGSFDMKGSFIDRSASPAVSLVPCPEATCEGENKPKAKFCCECGRPLAGISRSNTPGVSTPFVNFTSTPEIQKSPLDEKRESATESLKLFNQCGLFDTNMTQEKKKVSVISYIDSRLSEFENLKDGRYLLWKTVKVFVETGGLLGEKSELNKSMIELLGSIKEPDESTTLDHLEKLLLDGDREGAVQFATEHDMWDHALIISQSVQEELYKHTMGQFIDRALSSSGQLEAPITADKKSLRILYSLFSGADIVSQLTNNSDCTKDSLQDWKSVVSLALSNPSKQNELAIQKLGHSLKQCELLDESRICYLLSPNASVSSGLEASIADTHFDDLDLLYIMELYDFAVKEDHASIQSYKFVHAWWLADLGFDQESQHYRESIANAIGSEDHQPFMGKFKFICQQLLELSSNTLPLTKNAFDMLISGLEEKFNSNNFGGYGYGMNSNYQNTNPFSYGQGTGYTPAEPNYSASEQPSTVDQGSYNYSYGYTPENNTGYTPENNNNSYDSHNSYNPIDTNYQPPEVNATPAYQNMKEETKTTSYLNDGDNDLGFGNSSSQKKRDLNEENKEESKEDDTVKEEPKTEKSTGGGWGFFSMFSRKESSAVDEKKPVRANLGQESSFYFDEKEQRWVNKLNDVKPVAATPPPPPKSMTPQPAASVQSPPLSKPSNVPPRVSSAPVGAPPGSPSGTPPGFSTPPIGGSKRAGASGKKKPMRSRYVDVFNPPS